MSNDTKKLILTNLAKTQGEKAKKLLVKEYERLQPAILESTVFEEVRNALELLETFVFRVAETASRNLIVLINRLDSCVLELPDGFEGYASFSNASLQSKAMKILSQLRYLEQESVSETFLTLSRHKDDRIRNVALEELKNLAQIDLAVFKQININPQLELLRKIEAFPEDGFRENALALFPILRCFFTSTIRANTWDYDKVIISSSAIPANNEVKDLRQRALKLLKNIYRLQKDVNWKKNVLNVLQQATHLDIQGNIGETKAMIAANTLEVLVFYKSLIHTEELQIVQKIEHDSYWNYHHALNETVAAAALEIEEEIAKHNEYQIYRDLVGFEGIFGSWKKIKDSHKGHYLTEAERGKRVQERVESVTGKNFSQWEKRILEFVKTDPTDLATFPFLYKFVDLLARKHPNSMLRFLIENETDLLLLLNATVRGLWHSNAKEELKATIRQWVAVGKNLDACCKLFLSNKEFDKELFTEIYQKAISVSQTEVLTIALVVVLEHYSKDECQSLSEHLIPVLDELSKHKNTSWIYQIWYREERQALFDSLSEEAIDAMLRNLLFLREIDYQGEDILALIAKRNPKKIMAYFGLRLQEEKEHSIYRAIPFQFGSLSECLAQNATNNIAVVRSWYDGNYGMFIYKGARLLHNIYPRFSADFEKELIRLVKTKEEDNLHFVLAILRNYNGEEFTHPICIELVKVLAEKDKLLGEIAAALSSTGVVMGEFGFSEAYERKSREFEPWLKSKNKKVRNFAQSYIDNLLQDSQKEHKRAEEEIELRKFKYNVK